ncbi:MAG TPA: beta-N-acetylhexosaminidase [Kofleriaceae bacterium]|nr:beta-N-acetylhexosaminidase [Kofleriaceae bacterium]
MTHSLVDDVGQVLWVGFHGTEMPDRLRAQIAAAEVGVVVVFKRNLVIEVVQGPVPQEVVDVGALVELHRALHAAAPAGTPMLVAVDQEGGVVQRVRAPATQWPPMLSLDGHPAPDDEGLARAVGLALGRELAALGFDIDFAPVLDVHTNDKNPIIGDRALGRDAEAVARRALALADGLAASGVLACGKYFPGHGDTATDSHLELPRLDHAWERLDAVELLPFRRAAAAALPMIMTAHVVFAALDESVPATLSPAVIDGLLRRRLGYGGVIVSDDLDMHAIASHFGIGDAAVRAIAAGCDALLLCRDEAHQAEARNALIHAGERDSGLRTRLGEAAGRVRAMKAQHAASRRAEPPRGLDIIGALEHRQLADRLAGRA